MSFERSEVRLRSDEATAPHSMEATGCPIHAWAERSPEATALVFGDTRLNYRQLDAEVSRWAAWIPRGGRLAVLAHNRPETVALLFAARRAEATLVLLNARLTGAELAPQIALARPDVVLAESELLSRVPGARALTEPGPSPDAASPAAGPSVWLFTSGTTGRAKAAMLSWRALETHARASGENLGAGPDQRWLGTLPLFHVGGVAMAVRCGLYGATLLLERKFELERVAELLASEEVTHASLVPQTLSWLLDRGGRAGSSLRAVLIGGGPSAPELLALARAQGFPVLKTYGLTEACSQVTTERLSDADGETAGVPLSGLSLRITRDGHELAAGEEGEIELRGPTLMDGYAGDLAATAQTLRDGWLRTGDLGRLDARGRLTVLARRTDLILSGGENVYPAELEAVLSAHPAVAEVAVIGEPDARWGQVPVAALVARTAPVPDEALSQHCRARLAGFKQPRRFIWMDSLPRNATGKVDRVALARHIEGSAQAGKAVVMTGANAMHDISEADFLKQVETALADALISRDGEPASRSDTLMTASRHLCIGGGGKRIRPLMVRHFSSAASAKEGVVNVAVAAELVHSASLLHDDVVDAGMFRRGRPTVNALWGNIVAVMAGDLLLTVALEQLAKLDRQITYDAVATVKEMTYATIDEVEARGDLQLPVERYRRIAEGKTGALFGFCGRAAALLAGKADVASRFDAFGRHLGVAFQIADDLKDLRGSEPGKPQFADIKSRTPALPLVLAAAKDEALRRRMKDLWAFGTAPDEKVKEIGAAVLASSAPGEALAMMQREISAGLDALGAYGETEGGRELVGWAHKLAEAFGA